MTVQSPGAEYYPAAYWFWHRLPEDEEITSQLRQMREAGLKTFFIQARLAFPREEYLGEGYLRAYRAALAAARELGLTAILYDDYNWVSGHAGGRSVAGRDDLRERHLFWSTAEAAGGRATCTISGIESLMFQGMGAAGMEWVYEGGAMRWGDWQVLSAHAFSPGVAAPDPAGALDVSAGCRIAAGGAEGCTVTVTLPEAYPDGLRVVVFVAARCTSSRLINYLHPESGARFVAAGYEPYRRALAEYFGDPLKAVFFDHPYAGFYSWKEWEGNLLNSLMYDERLAAVFTQERGYPLAEALLAFILPEGPRTPRLRCDLLETYGRLGRENFFKPISAWARRYGLAVAGHELLSYIGGWGFQDGFSGLDARCNFGADYFAIDRYKDISTVDASNSQPQVSARVGASTARANGRRGCLIEQYYTATEPGRHWAAGQWDLTLDEVRAQAIRHTLLGARQYIFHAFFQSDGHDGPVEPFTNPRFDFPPGINYEPWFADLPDFAHELARLSAFLERGEPETGIAVLYPLRTFWAEGYGAPFAAHGAFWHRLLAEHNLAYDILDEEQILHGVIRQGSLETGNARYRALFLPGVSVLQSEETLRKIEGFAAAGGLVVASGPLPRATQQNGVDPGLAAGLERIFREDLGAIHFPDLPADEQTTGMLLELLRARFSAVPDVRHNGVNGGRLWTWSGRAGAEQRLALFNDSPEHRRVSVGMRGRGLLPERWSPGRGGGGRWGWYEAEPQNITLWVDLAPREVCCFKAAAGSAASHLARCTHPVSEAAVRADGSLLVTIHSKAAGAAELDIRSHRRPVLTNPLFQSAALRIKENHWKLQILVPQPPDPVTLADGWTFRAGAEGEAHPIAVDCGWEAQGFADFCGSGHYQNQIELPRLDRRWRWELNLPALAHTARVTVNGKQIGSRGWPPYAFIIPINVLRFGPNLLEIDVNNTAGNHYYRQAETPPPPPIPAGILQPPQLHPIALLHVLA